MACPNLSFSNEIVETFRQLDSIRTLEDVDIPVEVLE